MRELPLSVWKARRSVVRSPRSSGVSPSRCSASSAPWITSRASSRKISRISSSSSSPVLPCTSRLRRGRGAHRLLRGRRLGRRPARPGRPRPGPVRCAPPGAARRRWRAAAPAAPRPWSRPARAGRPAGPAATGGSAPAAPSRRRTSGWAAASASDCAWSTSGGGAPGLQLVEAAEGRQAVRAPAHHRRSGCRSRGRSGTATCAICGCTLSMSIRKLERAQVVGQAVEGAGLGGALRVDLGRGQRVDVVAHAQHGVRGLVHVQHREHAAHRRQLARAPGSARSRCAGLRKYWSICFSTSDSEARSSCTTLPMVWRSETRRYSSSIQARAAAASRPSRTSRMRCARRCTRLPISGWSKSPSSSEASRYSTLVATSIASAGARCRRRGHGLGDGGLQRLGQHLARRVQPLQRIADQRELLGQAAQAMRLAAGHRRPDFLGAGDALARLRDPGRVEAAQAHGLVVEGRAGVDVVGLAHGCQPRRRARPSPGARAGRRRTAGPAPGGRTPRSARRCSGAAAPAGAS